MLDLHSNAITKVQRLSHLIELRVLNLAGNAIQVVDNLSGLKSLTELNLRRNNIDTVLDLDALPNLQRVFLSHNRINSYDAISCVFRCTRTLSELALSENPIATDPTSSESTTTTGSSTTTGSTTGTTTTTTGSGSSGAYKSKIIASLPMLTHLDLQRITDEERKKAKRIASQLEDMQRHVEKQKKFKSQRDNAIDGIVQAWARHCRGKGCGMDGGVVGGSRGVEGG